VSKCAHYREQFSAYLDGAVTGAVMHEIATHLEVCSGCAAEFAQWRNAQSLVSSIGPAKAPDNLSLRLRVALSQQLANTTEEKFARERVRWQNTFLPLVWQISAGFASTDGTNPVVVQAFVNGAGRVYDYKIVSGNTDSKTRSQLEDTLLFSVFAPAQVFGQPVRGTVLLSFSSVPVRG
jgi:anti-sigma factor RsiW